MTETILLDQLLHGYNNGHKLITSSINLNSKDESKINVLSDLSGINSNLKFDYYFTGYPINNNQKYIFAKTWYADEMPRPGCVWTQSLVLDENVLKDINNFNLIDASFTRPSYEFEKKFYADKIPIILNQSNLTLDDNILFESIYLSFLENFVNTKKSIFIVTETNNRLLFEKFIINFWFFLWKKLRIATSFSTLSFSARKFENNLINIQLIDFDTYYNIKFNAENNIIFILDNSNSKTSNKKWTLEFLKNMRFGSNLHKIISNEFDILAEDRGNLKTLSSLAIIVDDLKSKKIEKDFLNILDYLFKLFPQENEGSRYKELLFKEETISSINNSDKGILKKYLFTLFTYDKIYFLLPAFEEKKNIFFSLLYKDHFTEILGILKLFSNVDLNEIGQQFIIHLSKDKEIVEQLLHNEEIDILLNLVSLNNTLYLESVLWSKGNITSKLISRFVNGGFDIDEISAETIKSLIGILQKEEKDFNYFVKSLSKKQYFKILSIISKNYNYFQNEIYLEKLLKLRISSLINWLEHIEYDINLDFLYTIVNSTKYDINSFDIPTLNVEKIGTLMTRVNKSHYQEKQKNLFKIFFLFLCLKSDYSKNSKILNFCVNEIYLSLN